ncbi:hypothetical protein ACHAXR_004844 [Thalassiosira sp. AJA248-18]
MVHHRPKITTKPILLQLSSYSYSILLLLLLVLQQPTIATSRETSACSANWSAECNPDRSVNTTIYFESEVANNKPNYDATVLFYWGKNEPYTSLGLQSYPTSIEHEEVRSYEYDSYGEYYAGYSVTFGEGSRCVGKMIQEFFVVSFDADTKDCGVENNSTMTFTTLAPTETPTTSKPTTLSPSKRPTDKPTTASPSKRPTNKPTTASPSKRPTIDPSKRPTDAPTNQTNAAATNIPLMEPTTSTPTNQATLPTIDVGSERTLEPTEVITRPPPVISPSPVVVTSAHVIVTSAPVVVTSTPVVITSAPVVITSAPVPAAVTTPSPAPDVTNNNIVPTKQPSPATSTPSPPSKNDTSAAMPMQEYKVSSTMVLYHSDEMDDDLMNMWRDVTGWAIRSEIVDTVTGVDPELVQVNVTLDNQTVSLSEGIRRRRNLQQVSSTNSFQLRIEYTTTIQFPSSENNDDWDANKLVAAAFQTPEKQQAYINHLKHEGDFESITSMSMPTTYSDGVTTNDEKIVVLEGNNNSILIGGVIGGICILIFATAAIAIYHVRRTSKSSTTKTQPSSATTDQQRQHPQVGLGMVVDSRRTKSPDSSNNNQELEGGQLNFGTISIGLKEGDMGDVSTIGNPDLWGAGGQHMDADNTVGPESMVSSLQRRLRPHGAGSSANHSSTINSGFSSSPMKFEDDATIENMYQTPSGTLADGDAADNELFPHLTVVCPSGKLGIVLDNPHGNMPIVYAIMDTSPLNGKIRVGDLLLSVDEVDCREMTAHNLSLFLSSRSQNPSRTLVLARGLGSDGTVEYSV